MCGGLVLYRLGNASGMDCEVWRMMIEPSGLVYDWPYPKHMIVTDLFEQPVEGDLKPPPT